MVDDVEEVTSAFRGDRDRRIHRPAAGRCGVHTKSQAHLVAVDQASGLGLQQGKIFVGVRRAEVLHALSPDPPR